MSIRSTVLLAVALCAPTAAAQAARPMPSGIGLQWQLDGTFDPNVYAQVYDLDLFETSAATVAMLRQRGAQTICYISVGTLENGRPDAASFPAAAVGAVYPEWPDERWLDIRRLDLIGPAIRARLDLCRDKGFDGVEPDNVDAYQQDNTGFAITEADEIAYLQWLSDEAHARGLSIGLKNVPELATRLQPRFDWALAEDCYVQGWCVDLAPFLVAGKAVFAVEYDDTGVDFAAACNVLAPEWFSVSLKHRSLNAWRRTCAELRRRVRSRPLPGVPAPTGSAGLRAVELPAAMSSSARRRVERDRRR